MFENKRFKSKKYERGQDLQYRLVHPWDKVKKFEIICSLLQYLILFFSRIFQTIALLFRRLNPLVFLFGRLYI